MKAEGIRRGADHVRQFTILGDGAAWIRNIATAKFPEVILSSLRVVFYVQQRHVGPGVCLMDMVISRFIQHVDEVEE